jgi:predicted TIM-barrel fold metal-dependent hydrolase
MKGIIDFHTHAFPDALAERALAALQHGASVKAFLDGRISSLIASMDRCGIQKSVVCSIATKPSQFEPILQWSKTILSERIIPLLSFHPADPEYAEKIRTIKGEGFKGIKLHPFYQEFDIDEERMLPMYDLIRKENLIVVMHTGFDIAFPRIRRADPAKILNIVKQFPDLKLVTTHLGSWEQWQEVEMLLAGKSIHMELSFSLEYLDSDPVKDILLKHPQEHLLFGTDSPWTDQERTLELFRGLDLGEKVERAILKDNAERLLNSV